MSLEKVVYFGTLLLLLISKNVHALIPRQSDVAFSSRWVHPTNEADKLNTLQAMQAFYTTQLLWLYLNDPVAKDQNFVEAVNKLGIPIQGTVSTAVMMGKVPTENLNAYGTKLDVYQRMKTSFGTHTFAGCPSSPIFQSLIIRKFQKALSYNIDSLQIDDWNFSYFAKIPHIVIRGHTQPGYRVEKCYCNYCLENFREFLKHKSAEELAKAGVTDVEHFDYRLFVLKNKWDPNRIELPIEEWYNESARHILTNFWEKNYALVQQLAKRKITISANNYQGQWAPIDGPFDFGIGEIGPPYTDPQYIFDSIQFDATKLNRPQVYSFASISPRENRHMIAITTASGGIALVPWDIYRGAHPRYYGLPKDYADLYGMIRALGRYLDDYQSLYAGGWHLIDHKTPPKTLEFFNTNSITAYVRNKDNEAPLVVHFVESSTKTKKFTFMLKLPEPYATSPVRCILFVPKPYTTTLHQSTEKDHDYTKLVHKLPLESSLENGYLQVHIPAIVNPWAIMIIEK